MLWDSETDQNWQQAIIKASSRDPAAAAALLAAKPRPPAPTLVTPADVLAAVDDAAPSQAPSPPQRRRLHPYDPAKLYSRLAKYYGFSHRELCRMDYRAFFMYVREMHLQLEAERDEAEHQRLTRSVGNSSTTSIDPTTQAAHEAQLASQLPAPQPYDGPVVPVVPRV